MGRCTFKNCQKRNIDQNKGKDKSTNCSFANFYLIQDNNINSEDSHEMIGKYIELAKELKCINQ